MIRYLLDTDTCVSYIRGISGVRDRLEEIGFDQCAISVITLAELKFGIENSSRPGIAKEGNRNILSPFGCSFTQRYSRCLRQGKNKITAERSTDCRIRPVDRFNGDLLRYRACHKQRQTL